MHNIAGLFSAVPGICRRILRQPNSERGYWQGRFDFLLSSVGYAVGLGNLWSFPHLCYSNGGGAFLIAYFVMVILVGVPITFLEMAFGQFTNMGPVHGWKGCPIMTGIGWSMCYVTGLISIYYNVIIAWSIYYLLASFTSHLPWSDCNNKWNDNRCLERGTKFQRHLTPGQQACQDDQTVNCSKFETATVQYFERVALGFVSYDGVLRRMDDSLGKVQWHLALCLLLSYVLVFLSLMRGIRTSGKIVHFTATFPFIALSAVLLRGVSLPGAANGLKLFFTPDFPKLLESSVWKSATVQAFFSMGIGLGGYLTLSSYNKINYNCYRDALIVPLVDSISSIISGIAVFSILGYMAHKSGLPVEKVVESGPGLAFIAFTEAVSTMPAGPLWSVLFFATLVTLGIDTQFIMLEIIMTAILDQWPGLRSQFRTELATKGAVCLAMFLLGLPMCCQGGTYLVDVVTVYSASFNVYIIVWGEIAGVCCFYGLGHFLKDIERNLGFRPGRHWIASWTVICPTLLLFIFIFTTVTYTTPKVVHNQTMTDWGVALGWSLMLLSLLIAVSFTFSWRPSVAAGTRPSRQSSARLRRFGLQPMPPLEQQQQQRSRSKSLTPSSGARSVGAGSLDSEVPDDVDDEEV